MLEDITTCNFVTVIVEVVMTDHICLLFVLWCCFLFFIIWFVFPVLPLSTIFATFSLHVFSSHLYFPPTFHFYVRLFLITLPAQFFILLCTYARTVPSNFRQRKWIHNIAFSLSSRREKRWIPYLKKEG